MAKVSKEIVINTGNYQSVRLGVMEAATFEECDQVIKAEITRLNIVNFQHAGVKQ